jgi:hypothetical protein
LFLARRTSGREPLVDYSHSHIVILEKYLTIMQQKAMDKEVAKHIKKKERRRGKTSKLER